MITLQHQEVLKIRTNGKQIHDITGQIQSIVNNINVQIGICHLFLRHTSASFIIQENADPDVLVDLENFLSKIVPENSHSYLHLSEGPDDMPAHIRTALTHSSEQIPIAQGRLLLGMWQAVYLWEHRQRGHFREVVVHLIGS